MAIPFLKHTPVGKSTQKEPYTSAANARYIMRKSAGHHLYSERMPVNWFAVQDFLHEREDNIRKNGRVCDKFILPLPNEMTPEQGIALARDFGFRLGKGRTPFFVAIHTDRDTNAHAHMIFVDADIETGKLVARTSDRNSTARIKKLWEDTQNEHLEREGYEARISFDDAERKAAERRELEQQAVSDIVPVPLTEEEPVVDYHTDGKSTAESAQRVAQMIRDMRYVRDVSNELAEAKKLAPALEVDYNNHVEDANLYRDRAVAVEKELYFAEKELEQHVDKRGRLKGFGISIFGRTFETKTRKIASEVKTATDELGNEYSHAASQLSVAESLVDEREHAIDSNNAKISKYEHLLSVYGSHEDIANTQKAYEFSADLETQKLDKAKLHEALENNEVSAEDYNTIHSHEMEMYSRTIDEPTQANEEREELRFARDDVILPDDEPEEDAKDPKSYEGYTTYDQVHEAYNNDEIDQDTYQRIIDEMTQDDVSSDEELSQKKGLSYGD